MVEGPFLDHNPGRLHQGTARCSIGLMPVSYEQEDAPPSESINASITAFVAPGLELKYVRDGSYKALVHIPVTEDNAYYDKVLTVNMICDDRQENYWALHRYMETIQSGQTNGYPIEDVNHRVNGRDGHYRNRVTYIPRVDIVMADDSYQKHQTIRFQRCYPAKIDDLQLNFGNPDPVTFVVHFIYTFKKIIREEPPSKSIVPPKGVTS